MYFVLIHAGEAKVLSSLVYFSFTDKKILYLVLNSFLMSLQT